jgi:16S rRNA (cytosine967-C5)-methyltransferase
MLARPEFSGGFDKVLLDAPCSGTGVLAKRADLRWRREPEQLVELASLQARLLEAAARAVKRGGLLVFSTCSIESEEGRERVDAFLASPAGAGFVLEPPPEGLVRREALTGDGACVETLPHVHGVDGAFAARLRRSAGP